MPARSAASVFSDDRILCRPVNGVPLHGDGILFLNNDPNFMLEGLNRFPAGMKLGVSYCYFPLEPLADDPLFAAVLEGVQYFQKTRVCEQKHLEMCIRDSRTLIESGGLYLGRTHAVADEEEDILGSAAEHAQQSVLQKLIMLRLLTASQ